MPQTNVIVFGEAGSGKTSLINMLVGDDIGETSSGAKGCTFKSTPYNATIHGRTFTLHDTAGMNEGDEGRVTHTDSIVQLYRLLRSLEDGVNLLIYVMRAPAKVRSSTTANWKMFYEIMCQNKVSIAIVVTGLEQEEPDMDSWWPANHKVLQNNGMIPHAHACITAYKGRKRKGQHLFQEEYDESRRKVQDMIWRCYQPSAWKLKRIKWMNEMVYTTAYESRKFGSPREKRVYSHTVYGAVEELRKTCGMSKEEAESLAETLEKI